MMRFTLLLSLVWLASRAVLAQGSTADPTELPIESLLQMEVTTVSKFPEKLSGAPGVMSVITQDELRRFGAMTVREALERVPGLALSTNTFTDRSMVAIRGDQSKNSGAHVLILLNGRPIRETQEGGVMSDLLQSFPVNALERIEVIRGPGSVLYGTNAFSGVINLITKKAVGQSATLRAYSAGGAAGGGSGEIMLERGKLNVVAAGQMRIDPLWRTTYGNLSQRPVFQSTAIQDRGPGAFAGLEYKGLRLMGGYSEWKTGAFVTGIGESLWRRGFANVGYTYAPSARWDMSLDLTHSGTRFATDAPPDIKRASSDTVLEWTNFIRPTSRDQITLGALYNHTHGRESTFGSVHSYGWRNSSGFYGQWEHRFTEEWKLVGGFQSNKIGPLALSTVPRMGVIWSPQKRVHVKALYGRAFRAPSLNETWLDHPMLKGSPKLTPERVGTLDLGVSYQSDRLLLAVNYFDSRQSGIIAPDGTFPPFRYRNFESFRIPGVELEGKYYLTDHWLLSGALLYVNQDHAKQHAAFGSVGLPTPTWIASGGVSYQLKKAFTASLFDVSRAAVTDYFPGLNPPSTSHHMMNAHSRLELRRICGESCKGMALFAHGVNLTGRELWLPQWGSNSGGTLPFQRGRTLYYGLEVALFRE